MNFSQFKMHKTYALPLDCFRISVGLLSLFYFIRAFIEAPYFLANNGLINHELVQKIFWYTWQPLFYPFMSLTVVRVILFLGMVLSVFLIIGYRSRLTAFILYFMVVCIYRYQFLVPFVDDVLMHLFLFWCIFLPIGKTLTLKKKQPIDTQVESYVLYLFLFNIALIYFVAGVSKFTSQLWLDGTALFAILKLPMGWFANNVNSEWAPLLKIGNYAGLISEPLFVLLVFLKPWSKFKTFLGFCLIIFHLSILTTIDIPFANLGCLFLIPILFRHELMEVLFKKNQSESYEQRFSKEHFVPTLMIVFLTGAMTCALTQDQWRKAKRVTGTEAKAEIKSSSADTGGMVQTVFYGGLWVMGLAQGYRLLDWIDERNFHQKIEIHEYDGKTKQIFPRSKLVPVGMRGTLILTYINDITWMYVNPDYIDELRLDIKNRLIQMYCRNLKNKTTVEIWHTITRIDSFNPRENPKELMLQFVCEGN